MAATAQTPVQCEAELSHGRLWELEWGLGSSFESLASHRRKRRELTGGANGGWWRTVVLSGARKGMESGGFIGPTRRRGGFARASWPIGAVAWRGGGWRRAAGFRPMAEGGARTSVCAAATWHRPRGGRCHAP
jgi:hypothetical protein